MRKLIQIPGPFPKDEKRFLSYYRYKKRYIEITPNGEIVGGLSRMFVSLVDLSAHRKLSYYADSEREESICYLAFFFS